MSADDNDNMPKAKRDRSTTPKGMKSPDTKKDKKPKAKDKKKK